MVAMEESVGNFADECRIGSRTRELEWLKNHRNALAELAGNWIVIEGACLIASRPSYEAARQAVRDAGIVRPFITFVPESTEEAFMGL